MRSVICRPEIAMMRTWVARSATASSATASTRTSPLALGAAFLAAGVAGAGDGVGSGAGLGSGRGGDGGASTAAATFAAGGGTAGPPSADRRRSSTSAASTGGSAPRETDSTSDVSSSTTRVSSGIMPGRAACSTSSAAWHSSASAPIRIMRPAPFSVWSSRLASTTDCGSASRWGRLLASRSRRSRASSTKRGTRSANSASKAAPGSDLGPTVDVDVQPEHPFQLPVLVYRRGGGEDGLAREQRVEERRQDGVLFVHRRLVPGALGEALAGLDGGRHLALADDL